MNFSHDALWSTSTPPSAANNRHTNVVTEDLVSVGARGRHIHISGVLAIKHKPIKHSKMSVLVVQKQIESVGIKSTAGKLEIHFITW